jgi:hypothetical protein
MIWHTCAASRRVSGAHISKRLYVPENTAKSEPAASCNVGHHAVEFFDRDGEATNDSFRALLNFRRNSTSVSNCSWLLSMRSHSPSRNTNLNAAMCGIDFRCTKWPPPPARIKATIGGQWLACLTALNAQPVEGRKSQGLAGPAGTGECPFGSQKP